jgi:hypothetical protein
MALLFVALGFMALFASMGVITLTIGAGAKLNRWHSFAVGALLGPFGIVPMLVVAVRNRPPDDPEASTTGASSGGSVL